MMNTLSFNNKKNVIIVGSMVGRIADFADDIANKYHNTLILCAGDVGFGRGHRRMQDMEIEYLENTLAKNDNVFCTIRGNKDNPLYFNLAARIKYVKGLEDYLKHIFFIGDYDIVATSKGNFLCVGGGIDKNMPDEVIPIDPTLTIKDGAAFSNTWFKGSEIETPDFIPEMEEVEGPEGNKITIDTNEFNNWLKMSRPTMVLSYIHPSDIDTYTVEQGQKNEEKSYSERDYLSRLRGFMEFGDDMNIKIKSWYWNRDVMPSIDKPKEVGTINYIPVSSMSVTEVLD